MVKRKGVTLVVDEKFFNTFERERQKEQNKLRVKMGNVFNLTQRDFTSILALKNFKFQIPKQTTFKKRRKI